MKLIVKGKAFTRFECECTIYSANELLKMLSQIDEDNIYSPISFEVESSIKHIIGKKYNICDNSYIIDIETKEYASLVQNKSNYYSPDDEENGSSFIICSYPYVERDGNIFNHYHIFVNVISTKTHKTYRVLFYEGQVITLTKN